MKLKIPASLRGTLQTINRRLNTFIQRWAISLTLLVHLAASLVALFMPPSPYKNATIASLVLAGFAVPATWTAAAARTHRLRRNGWRENTKTLYLLWVPLMSFFAYGLGGAIAQQWYGGLLTPTYYYTSLAYAPFGFLLQWTLAAGDPSIINDQQKSSKTETSRFQPLKLRLQCFMLHPLTYALNIVLVLLVLLAVIWYGLILYIPVLLHQKSGLPATTETLTLTSLNSGVIMLITSLCWLRTALPGHREYIQGPRMERERLIARVALIFGIARATLNGTWIAGIIYGFGFLTSQWLTSQHIAPALAVYGKEGVANTLWLLAPLVNAREQVSVEQIRASITRVLHQAIAPVINQSDLQAIIARIGPEHFMQASIAHLSAEWEESIVHEQGFGIQLDEARRQYYQVVARFDTARTEHEELRSAHLTLVDQSDPQSQNPEQPDITEAQLTESWSNFLASRARLVQAQQDEQEARNRITDLKTRLQEAEQVQQARYARLKAQKQAAQPITLSDA